MLASVPERNVGDAEAVNAAPPASSRYSHNLQLKHHKFLRNDLQRLIQLVTVDPDGYASVTVSFTQ